MIDAHNFGIFENLTGLALRIATFLIKNVYSLKFLKIFMKKNLTNLEISSFLENINVCFKKSNFFLKE